MTPGDRLDAPWLHERTLVALLGILDRAGEEARVIGGAVRNALLGESIGDVDIATTAVPEEVARRAAAAGFKPVPTGIQHGTVTVIVEGRPYEVTTLRRDVETFGRRASVVFGRDWRADAERRDFTINALSVAPDGTVYDYVGGLADIAVRRVRFIGDPATRIAEDYLRVLRFFRFQAMYGEGPPDAAALRACIGARAGLASLSRERIRMELLKLLVARHVVPAVVSMSEAGLLLEFIGGVPLLASLTRLVEAEASLGLAPDAIRRLGALGLFVTEDADRLRERLRLTNGEHARLLAMSDSWWRLAPEEAMGRELLYRLGPVRYLDRALLAWSRVPAPVGDSAWRTFASLPQRWQAPPFPLRAADMVARGVAPGPALGRALKASEQAWIDAGFPQDVAPIADGVATRLRAGHTLD